MFRVPKRRQMHLTTGQRVVPWVHGEEEPEVGMRRDTPGAAIDIAPLRQKQLAFRLE